VSKHIINRLCEFTHLEHAADGVRVFAIHPGAVLSPLAKNDKWIVPQAIDPPELSAGTMVRLTSGSEDYLSGRWFSSNWDLDDVRPLPRSQVRRP
jgi:NAD(P)-dependent dehydrogenase (short-subunit alcohol dehydrogenase family)